MTAITEEALPAQASVLGIRNIGEPLRFKDVQPLSGVSAEAAKPGQPVKIWTRLALTSDEPHFHRIVDDLDGVVRHMAIKAGASVNLRRADTVLLVLKPDNSAEQWVDTAAVSVRCAVKQAIAARTVVFESDIADVTGMSFPCIEFGEQDKVICLFRGAGASGSPLTSTQMASSISKFFRPCSGRCIGGCDTGISTRRWPIQRFLTR